MNVLQRRRREVETSSPLHALFAPYGLGEGVLYSKTGVVSVAFRVSGVDPEGLDVGRLEAVTRGIAGALKRCDESTRLSQYLVKRQRADGLSNVSSYLVVSAEGLHDRRAWWLGLRPKRSLADIIDRVGSAKDRLATVAETVSGHLAPWFSLEPLSDVAWFTFLRQLINPDAVERSAAYARTDDGLAEVVIRDLDAHLLVGDRPTLVLAWKDAPAKTSPVMLWDGWMTLPGDVTVCVDWQRWSVERFRHALSRRRHHHVPVNVSRAEAKADLDALGHAVAYHRHAPGEMGLTIVVSGPQAKAAAVQATRHFSVFDGVLVEQADNRTMAWLGMLPGQQACNLRRLFVLDIHAADMSPLFSVNTGRERDDRGRPPLLMCRTQQHTPHAVHLHVHGDLGHTGVYGPTGSGKTYLLNAMARGVRKQYDASTVIFDIGHGYRALAAELGGSYLEFGLSTGAALNPFECEGDAADRYLLLNFVRLLVAGRDDFPISDADAGELRRAISALFEMPVPMRRLSTLMRLGLPAAVSDRLAPWVGHGPYAQLFDHERDTVQWSSLQVFEFGALREFPDLQQPLLFVILHRLTRRLSRDRLTVAFLDEVWRFVKHPVLRDYLHEAFKTWRKHHDAALVIATQSIADFDPVMLETVVESCAHTYLLANPDADHRRYAEVFGLNAAEVAAWQHLRPRSQFLRKQHGQPGAKCLELMGPAAA
jgi:type IV secretion system protein VirB4